MNDNLNNVTILPPFKKFCMTIGELPTSYVESMTYYESLVWLCNYLGKSVIPALNANGEAVIELQEKYIELKNYVDNYFENLDVQEEINNKLDEMADQGELADIIAQYLEFNSVIGFDNKAALKSADNLTNGSITRTLGTNSYNDGKGNFYKIRTLEEGDVIDDDNLLALSEYPTLVAEKMPDYRMNQAETNIGTLNTNVGTLQTDVSNLQKLVVHNKYVFIGDSYLDGWTPEGTVQNWGVKVANLLGLTSSRYYIISRGGTAMNSNNPNNFYNLLENETIDNDVTDVILAAGYNDHQSIGTYSSIKEGMTNFKARVAYLYPNATLKIGFIGNTSVTLDKYDVMCKCPLYIRCCQELGIDYLNNVEYALHNYGTEFGSDGIHPNETGQAVIAEAIYQALKTGSAHVSRPRTPVFQNGSNLYCQQENNIITFINTAKWYDNDLSEPTEITMNGNNRLLINTTQFDNSLIQGCGSSTIENSATIPVFFVENTTLKTYQVNCRLELDNGYLCLYPLDVNDAGNNYRTIVVKSYQIRPFAVIFNALYN